MLVYKKGTKTTVPDKKNDILLLVVILIKNINLLWHEKSYISYIRQRGSGLLIGLV